MIRDHQFRPRLGAEMVTVHQHTCLQMPPGAEMYTYYVTKEWLLLSDTDENPPKYCPFCGEELSK